MLTPTEACKHAGDANPPAKRICDMLCNEVMAHVQYNRGHIDEMCKLPQTQQEISIPAHLGASGLNYRDRVQQVHEQQAQDKCMRKNAYTNNNNTQNIHELMSEDLSSASSQMRNRTTVILGDQP